MAIQIKNIVWERIYLKIELDGEKINEYSYYIVDSNKKSKFKIPTLVNNILSINITNVGNQRFLKNNKWFFIAQSKQSDTFYLPVAHECLNKLNQLDKIYRYKANAYAFICSFSVENINDVLTCALTTTFMKKNENIKKINYKIEYKTKKGRLKEYIIFHSEKVIGLLYHLLSKLPQKKETILLISETRVPMGGNLLALYNRMVERKLDKQFIIKTYFKKTNQKDPINTFIRHLEISCLMAKSKYVFLDDYLAFFKYITPNKNQNIIQLWHAGVGFKDVGFARFGENGGPHPIYTPHYKNDYVIVGSANLQDIYAEVFQIDKNKCLPYGLPRVDDFKKNISAQNKEKFLNHFPHLKNKKIILYAPTFRGTLVSNAYFPMEKINQDIISKICKDEYAFIVKMHPYVKDKLQIKEEFKNIIYDFSDYPDNDLLLSVSDILITDYSSIIYEYSLLEKPIIFYAFDEVQYALTRGFHRSLNEFAPGKVCHTMEEVQAVIQTKTFDIAKTITFKNKYFTENNINSSDLIINNLLLNEN